MSASGFPKDFLWGASTSSYQIEGSPEEGGKGPSIWDAFCAEPGRIADASSGARACDSWRLWSQDLALLSGLGANAYRFSVAWPRVQPTGRGRPLTAGLDWYKAFSEALLEAGIEPWITLYHWDLPLALEEAGGWPIRDTALRFQDYADIVTRALGGLVKSWVTLNEPWCSSFLGYATGEHAPGHRDLGAAYRAAHHLLLGHGLGMAAIRANVRDSRAGIVINPAKPRAASPSPEDEAASLRASVQRTGLWLDPVFGKGYPEAHLAAQGVHLPVESGDLEVIGAPVDFVGVNYYNEDVVKAVPRGPGSPEAYAYVRGPEARTAMDWAIVPEGLTRILAFIHESWAPELLYVTENGAAFDDPEAPDGSIDDQDRIAYLESHLEACEAALSRGIPLKGYFAWTLVDNFEWAWGFSRKFGLCSLRPSGERRPKASYARYARIIREARGG